MGAYHMDEASFDLPDEWKDQSVNVFSSEEPEGHPIALLVSRDKLAGKTLEQFVDVHLKAQSQKLRGYLLMGSRERKVGGLSAIEVKLQWLHDSGTMYHRQLYVEYYDKVVTFTASSVLKRLKDCDAAIGQVFSSLRFRRR